MASDAAKHWVVSFEVERGEIEMTHIDVPGGKGTGDGREAVEAAVFSLALDFGLVDGGAGGGWVPFHHCFLAVA